MKKYFDYKMNFKRNWTTASGALMGFALFARMVYCFALRDISQIGIFEWIFIMALPLLASGVYVVLLRIAKWDYPGIFAILGAVSYMLVLVGNILSGDLLRTVLSCIIYAAAIFLLLATSGGYLPDKIFVLAVGFLIPVLRLFLYDLTGWAFIQGIGERLCYFTIRSSDMAVLLSLFCLPMSLKSAQS